MTSLRALVAAAVALPLFGSLGGTPTPLPTEISGQTDKSEWEYSFSTSVYVVRNEREYVNPTFTADREWLHVEGRYNYEAINTGSVWLGWNFSAGEKLVLEVTPMVGGVFGNLTGIAPGYSLSLTYKQVEFFTQGEYFFDAANREENFFYTWSELSLVPVQWFRLGVVIDRTKALGSSIDIRRGPLVGFKYKDVDLTTYWLSPGSSDATFVFAVTVNF
jgi:hypothetical protein